MKIFRLFYTVVAYTLLSPLILIGLTLLLVIGIICSRDIKGSVKAVIDGIKLGIYDIVNFVKNGRSNF